LSALNIQVKALVDDNVWMIGANHFVDSEESYIFPWFYTQNGRYTYVRDVFSPQLNNTRDVVVYLPPSYDENPFKTYNRALIMHDGQNLFNASTSAFGTAWMVQNAMDPLIFQGIIEEMVRSLRIHLFYYIHSRL
jgi:enterochelin esterase-like enzyme